VDWEAERRSFTGRDWGPDDEVVAGIAVVLDGDVVGVPEAVTDAETEPVEARDPVAVTDAIEETDLRDDRVSIPFLGAFRVYETVFGV